MPGLNLRSLRVDLTYAFKTKRPVKLTEQYGQIPVAASPPIGVGGWRPGFGVPAPVPAISPDEMEYMPALPVATNPTVNPIPARSM
jgi:hypothetical protein